MLRSLTGQINNMLLKIPVNFDEIVAGVSPKSPYSFIRAPRTCRASVAGNDVACGASSRWPQGQAVNELAAGGRGGSRPRGGASAPCTAGARWPAVGRASACWLWGSGNGAPAAGGPAPGSLPSDGLPSDGLRRVACDWRACGVLAARVVGTVALSAAPYHLRGIACSSKKRSSLQKGSTWQLKCREHHIPARHRITSSALSVSDLRTAALWRVNARSPLPACWYLLLSLWESLACLWAWRRCSLRLHQTRFLRGRLHSYAACTRCERVPQAGATMPAGRALARCAAPAGGARVCSCAVHTVRCALVVRD